MAGQLISGVKDRQKKELFSENEEGDKVVVAACSSESAEVEFVVSKIKEMVGTLARRRDGTESPLSYRDFVILARRKLEGKKFAKALKAYGIPTIYMGEANIFAAPVVRDFMAYLQVASAPTRAGVEIYRLMKTHGITETNIARINHVAGRKAREEPSSVDFVFDTLHDCEGLVTQADECKEVADQLDKICALAGEAVSRFVYEVIMSASDLYRRAVRDSTPEGRRNQLLLKELYSIALEFESLNPQGTLADFIKYLSLMGQFDLELEEDYWAEDAVQVTTIHQSKGREFAVVFGVDIAANKFPPRYREKAFYVPNDLSKGVKRDEDEKALYVQEERRLLYVAMTRAQSRLFLTYAKRYGQNVRETKLSKFLDEISFAKNQRVEVVAFDGTKDEVSMQTGDRLEKLKDDLQGKAIRSIGQMQLKSAVQRIIELAKVRHFQEHGTLEGFDPASVLAVDNTDTNLDLGLVGKKIPLINKEELRLSATKIETYLECPLKFKFMHIQEAPQPPTKYFALGKAVHSVAEHLTKMQAEGVQPTEELALDILKKKWSSEPFKSTTEEMQSKEKAREMIRTYLKWVAANKNRAVAVEKRFQIEIAGVTFAGSIDRLEQRPDGEYEIVDFKTGKAYKNSKSIREDPQVNIYALAVQSLYGKLPARASLYYLMEDKMVPYDVDMPQVENVKEEVEQATADILAEKFDATPSYITCGNCPYKAICDSSEIEN